MLSRQKIMLSLLKLAGRAVGQLEFMQWAFLLRNEFPSEGGSAFYDFVPYHSGPYSFTLNHEVGKLEAEGLLVASETTWLATKGDWPESLEPAVLRDLSAIIRKFTSVPPNQLLDEIYARFRENAIFYRLIKLTQLSTYE